MKIDITDSYYQSYELAQSECGKLSKRPQSSKDWVDFFVNSTTENSDVYFCSGVAAFITEKEVASLDMRTFKKSWGNWQMLLDGICLIPVWLTDCLMG